MQVTTNEQINPLILGNEQIHQTPSGSIGFTLIQIGRYLVIR